MVHMALPRGVSKCKVQSAPARAENIYNYYYKIVNARDHAHGNFCTVSKKFETVIFLAQSLVTFYTMSAQDKVR